MTREHDRAHERMRTDVSTRADAAARDAAQSGSDVAVVAEVFLIGVMRDARKMEGLALRLVRHAAESFIKSALKEGLDPGAAAKGLVEGAATGRREQGWGAGTAVAIAEQGAIDAADRAGPEAGRKVREALLNQEPGRAVRTEPARRFARETLASGR
jgi:hypothetical protein